MRAGFIHSPTVLVILGLLPGLSSHDADWSSEDRLGILRRRSQRRKDGRQASRSSFIPVRLSNRQNHVVLLDMLTAVCDVG